jgi:hypothetical protein
MAGNVQRHIMKFLYTKKSWKIPLPPMHGVIPHVYNFKASRLILNRNIDNGLIINVM